MAKEDGIIEQVVGYELTAEDYGKCEQGLREAGGPELLRGCESRGLEAHVAWPRFERWRKANEGVPTDRFLESLPKCRE